MGKKKPRADRFAPSGGWSSPGKTVPDEARAESTGKQVRGLDLAAENVHRRRPVWRFADLDDDGPWALSACSTTDLPDIFAKLKTFESMTIGEIFSPGSDHGKSYSVETLPKHALDRLTELRRDDETELVRLRFSGKKRFYGILREHVFHVLWWDPEHEVYPSQKRNT